MEPIILLTWKWTALISGIYFIFLSFSFDTENYRSMFMFKVRPMILGITSLGISLKLFDIV